MIYSAILFNHDARLPLSILLKSSSDLQPILFFFIAIILYLRWLRHNPRGNLLYRLPFFSPYRSKIDAAPFFNSERKLQELRDQHEPALLQHIPYYVQLKPELQRKFLLRIPYFLREKNFRSTDEMEVTDEMKTLIAGSAIQLTLGLENFIFASFHTIIITPHKYLSPITHKYHIGEARPGGVIMISWEDFLKGYQLGHDTYNVGLHELAHALELDTHAGNLYDDAFGAHYDRWEKVSYQEYQNMQDDSDHFLRDYAGTNLREFFAVCVEHFFEASNEFRSAMPELYEELAYLLNQDPAEGIVGS